MIRVIRIAIFKKSVGKQSIGITFPKLKVTNFSYLSVRERMKHTSVTLLC